MNSTGGGAVRRPYIYVHPLGPQEALSIVTSISGL